MSYILPFGPYQPSLKEPIHFKLYTEGETVREAEFFVGFNHKGIEKLAQAKGYIQSIPLMERVCGMSSHSNSLAYCLGIESILQIEVSKRANYIRVIFCELERIQGHLLWLAHLSQILAFDSLLNRNINLREKILETVESICGNRIHYGINIIGGVRKDINYDKQLVIYEMIKYFSSEYKIIKNTFMKDSSILHRTKSIGVLTKLDAIEYNATGPLSRASGINYDVRKDEPYCNYEDFIFEVPISESGDIFSRITVMLIEMEESLKIIQQAIENLPDGEINQGFNFYIPQAGEALSRVESPMGELSYFLVSNDEGNNERVSIHTATYRNLLAFPIILKNSNISDSGLIINSINPGFAGVDR